MNHFLARYINWKFISTLAAVIILTFAMPVIAQEEDEEPQQATPFAAKNRGPEFKRSVREIANRRMAPNRAPRVPQLRARNIKAEAAEEATENTEESNNVEEAPAQETIASAPAKASNNSPQASSSATGGSAQNSDEESSIDYNARNRKGKFLFDFNKANVEDVIKAISDITRKNFIIPEKIKGQKITILCPTQVTAYEAYQAFLSALEINNLTLVKSGKFYKLTNAKDAIKSPIPTYYDDASSVPWNDSLVTILLRLKYSDAQNISNLVKGLISSDGSLTVYQQTNTLIISDYGNNIHRIKDILDRLDQEGGQEEIQILPIENATASEMAEKIKQIFDVDKKQAGNNNNNNNNNNNRPGRHKGPADNNTATATDAIDSTAAVTISKIIPDDRTNQLIIVANHDSFAPIIDLIQKLDIQLTDDEGQIRVYYLKNAVAEDIANTLSTLAQGKSSSTTKNNNKNAKAKSPTSSDAALFEGEVKITADKATNSLVVISSARDYKSLKKVIEELDRPRLQVYIEAAILEVNVSDNKQFGTGWHSGIPFDNSSGDKNLSKGLGFVQSSSNSTMTTVTSASGVADLFNIFSGAIGGILGEMFNGTIGGTSVTIPSFGVVLKALQSNSNAKIISTPHITATDNEEAELEVGQKIPFQEGYGSTLSNLSGLAGSTASSALSAYAGLYSRTDRIDVSMKLNLTPHINESGKVRLEVDLSIEDMVGKDEATGQPITATRKAKTVITPDDQQTVVIGGLIRDRVRESESKIPLLGNIPVLGWLFKTRSWETERVNLLVILTPYIIKDQSDFQAIAKRKLAEHQRFADLFYGGSEEYRAYIDYSKKNGVTAMLLQEINNELQRIENGGDGNGEETLIQPSTTAVEFDDVSEEIHQPQPAEQTKNEAPANVSQT